MVGSQISHRKLKISISHDVVILASEPDAMLRNLNLNWCKSYDKKHKNTKNTKDENLGFCTESQKKQKWKYFCFLS